MVRQKIYICIITALLFAAVCATGAYAATTGTITDDGVNIRKSASTGSPIITQARKGQVVTITGSEGAFYHIYYEGVSDGWVSSQFVKTSGGGTPSSSGTYGTGRVTGSNINIRSKPSVDSAALGKAQTGDTFQVKGLASGWYQIVYNNADGYIISEFLQVGAEAAPVNTSVTSPAEGVGTAVDANINIRATASTSGAVLGQAMKGDTFPVTALQDGWYKIVYNNSVGYIKSEYLQLGAAPPAATAQPAAQPVVPPVAQPVAAPAPVETIYATVTSDTGLYLRALPNQESAALNTLTYGEVIDVVSLDVEWVAVTYEGMSGYVSAEHVLVERGIRPLTETTHEETSPKAYEIIEYGKQFLGTPYVYGGTNLRSGVDCSGFVYAVMREHDVHLNRSSYEMAKNGVTVQRSQLQPGDLVFFDTDRNGRISHVGIYIGNKKFIHSSSSRRTWGVTISSLEEQYYSIRFVTANRVL